MDVLYLHLLFEDHQNIKWVGLYSVSIAHQNGPSVYNHCYSVTNNAFEWFFDLSYFTKNEKQPWNT